MASFANIGQLLVLSTASIDLLNTKRVAVSAETFRPNVVLEGVSQPHEEDTWVSFRVGEHALRVRQCSRCTMVNINQRSGVQLEPLLTESIGGSSWLPAAWDRVWCVLLRSSWHAG